MAIELWNTLTRRKEPIEPIHPPGLRLFVCGPTVYDSSHLGHAKTYTQFDLAARHMRHRGLDVNYVQNITDIDDKIINRANELGVSAEELARRVEAEFREDMEALGNTSVDTYARATDYMDQIVSQIERLIAGGHAYELPDGWYFDIETFAGYGKLARRRALGPEDAVSRVDENPLKRHPGDFALWKRRKENEPFWDTPLGQGRPGWHIEDTAITESLFGAQYDMHGGAIDLIFPHHEAEIAQMEAISGREPLVRYWMHTGFLNLREEKMSKSLGNFFTIRETLKSVDARVLRYFLLSHHYRSPIDYDPELLEQAAAALRRLENFVLRLPADEAPEDARVVSDAREAMLAALDDDFDAPGALGVLFAFIRDQNRADRPADGSRRLLEEFDSIFRVLSQGDGPREGHDDAWIQQQVDRRQQLRADSKFAEADALRDELAAAGVVVEDTADGVRWHREAAPAG